MRSEGIRPSLHCSCWLLPHLDLPQLFLEAVLQVHSAWSGFVPIHTAWPWDPTSLGPCYVRERFHGFRILPLLCARVLPGPRTSSSVSVGAREDLSPLSGRSQAAWLMG